MYVSFDPALGSSRAELAAKGFSYLIPIPCVSVGAGLLGHPSTSQAELWLPTHLHNPLL